jgi:hypothetical protein
LDFNQGNTQNYFMIFQGPDSEGLSFENSRSFYNIIKRVLQIPCIIILPIRVLIKLQNHKEANLNRSAWFEIQSSAWARVHFSLPDITRGWLISNSSVRCNRDFTSDRLVTLRGEAFFDVNK